MQDARVLVTVLSLASAGCYHWVPTTLAEVGLHPGQELRVSDGRQPRIVADRQELLPAPPDAIHVPSSQPAKLERRELDVPATFASTATVVVLSAAAIVGIVFGVAWVDFTRCACWL